jgi:hypothetical protein
MSPLRPALAAALLAPSLLAGTPAAREPWTFDAEQAGALTVTGAVQLGQPGPRRPDYPRFSQTNRAARFEGRGARLEIADPGAHSPFDFGQGDALTLEAWVRLTEIGRGENVYLIGKGRTDPRAANPNNQNWALRLREARGAACPSFLFASATGTWHRWTAGQGLRADGRWHHVAVTYVFGQPESVRAYLDGEEVTGDWDMAGATKAPPIVDDAPVWVGSSMGGSAGSSFRGLLDEVRVHRAALAAAELRARFATTLPAPAAAPAVAAAPDPNAGNDSAGGTPKGPSAGLPAVKAPQPADWSRVPTGAVQVELCEEWRPEKNLWPEAPLAVTDRFSAPAFGFFRVPHRYVDTGVRGARPDPYLLKAHGRVTLPAGRHRLLLRSRGAAALFVDDRRVAITPFPPPGTDDKPVKIQDTFLDLGGNFRFAPPGNRDAWAEFESHGGEHRITLETVVGYVINARSRRRPELGETVAAWSPQGSSQWYLLAPGAERPVYDDAGWSHYAAAEETRLAAIDAAARAAQRAQHATYWERRRADAAAWLAATPETPVPALPAGFPAQNAIDHFLAERIVAYRAEARASAHGGIDFWTKVQPILESRCLECHQGGKAKGELHLDARATALKGGASGEPALVPGRPEHSQLLQRILSRDPDEQMPPKGPRLSREETETLTAWIRGGAVWPEFPSVPTTPTPLADDLTFLRRVTLDTVGVPPSLAEIAAFQADRSPDRRARVIDRLLADPRAADHGMGYWQDVLAENPNILNPTLNNSGPFRWWLLESLQDRKALDLMVTELVRLGGSAKDGGPAGFGIASQNDVPFAAKATVLTTAFLGVESKCARCHDSPSHQSKQEQVFGLAAMLETKGIKVPASSSVPLAKLREGGRKPLIEVTLEPGTTVPPHWPFPEFAAERLADELAEDPANTRERLAALLTAPQNERFAQVMANRLWARVMGRGLVDQPWDWERSRQSHPALLRWLGRELVRSGFAADHLLRLIFNSHAYQRQVDPTLARPSPLFAAPATRRLTAEQIVDGAFAAVGKPFRTEEASLDIDSIRETTNSVSLGQPRRAWMLTSTSNERDRPSLALPRIQAVCDVLAAFGWRSSRPDPLTDRENAANTLQPAILGNGTVGAWLTGLSDDHAVTALALTAANPEALVDTIFLRLLTRAPSSTERERFASLLRPGFASRIRTPTAVAANGPRRPAYYVSWSNHLDADATRVRQAEEAAARRGDPPTARLEEDWRRRAEDVLWALVNSPEFIFSP